jgi:hypothetical protein
MTNEVSLRMEIPQIDSAAENDQSEQRDHEFHSFYNICPSSKVRTALVIPVVKCSSIKVILLDNGTSNVAEFPKLTRPQKMTNLSSVIMSSIRSTTRRVVWHSKSTVNTDPRRRHVI